MHELLGSVQITIAFMYYEMCFPQLYMGIGASGTPYLYVTLSFIDNFL